MYYSELFPDYEERMTVLAEGVYAWLECWYLNPELEPTLVARA